MTYENSPKAFVDSAKLGIVYHNVDIVFSSDGVPFVFHDLSATDVLTGNTFVFADTDAETIKT